MLRKKTNGVARRPQRTSILPDISDASIDRRTFLRGSGLAIGGLAAVGAAGGMVSKAEARAAQGAISTAKSVCTHCSVGCSVIAEVDNGVWVGQEPGWDSPFNLGAHCAKGAAVREHANGERRLKYPMKKEGGEWKRIGWDQAIDEIGDGGPLWQFRQDLADRRQVVQHGPGELLVTQQKPDHIFAIDATPHVLAIHLVCALRAQHAHP